MVGMRRVPVIAARHVLFSAFHSLAMLPSAFQLYHTGFDSLSAPTFDCSEVSALAFHGGIQAEFW